MYWSYDRFTVGAVLGTREETISDEILGRWLEILPGDRAFLPFIPPGLATAVVMRAYMHILADRPPGNIHIGNAMHIVRMAPANVRLRTRLRCIHKAERKGRPSVSFEALTDAGDAAPVYRSRIDMLWAA